MKLDLILRVVSKIILPFTLLFAFYVQLHADYGPGGGFQAGVIAAGVIILYALMFGNSAAKRVASPRLVEFMIPAGVLLYLSVGLLGILLGKNFLDYSVLGEAGAPQARERGIFWVEIGVLISVSGTMIALYYAFTDRSRS
ncbi:MAG: hypothetical protein RLZ98_2896 [Pseudomonadota bacterium]|jgi:multicomponent Na+:H+ antiporter subunit B